MTRHPRDLGDHLPPDLDRDGAVPIMGVLLIALVVVAVLLAALAVGTWRA
jgi:hypothetical protein